MSSFQSVALLLPEIKELLEKKDFALLKQVLRECNPMDFADCWKRFGEEERLQIFKLIPTTAALKLFEILDVDDQRALFAKLSEENVTPILEGMDSPDLARIFHKMSPRAVKKMTSLIKQQGALAHVELLMKYPQHTAGSLMHPEFVKLSPKLTARQALSTLQAIVRPNQGEHLYYLFMTEDDGKVVGSLTLQDLISAPQDETLSKIMTSVDAIKVKPETDQEEVAKLFTKYRLNAVPVANGEGQLIGVLTANDILPVLRQEATEDIAKMVGTQASDIKERSVFRIIRLRMPWLAMTLLAQLLVATVISSFEKTLGQMLILASFLPLIAAMGGNVGSQSAMIMVRSLALGTVNGNHKLRTIFREFRVGLALGILYGVSLAGAAHFLYSGPAVSPHFPLIIGVSICFSMTFAATMGSIGPLVLEKLKVDPATATGPLITTTTDLLSTSFYFILATVLLFHL